LAGLITPAGKKGINQIQRLADKGPTGSFTNKRRSSMFEVTEKASEMVQEFFKTRDKVEPLRIFIAGIG